MSGSVRRFASNRQWRAMRTHRRLAAAGRYHRRCVPGQRKRRLARSLQRADGSPPRI
jgi:hypothetical protein